MCAIVYIIQKIIYFEKNLNKKKQVFQDFFWKMDFGHLKKCPFLKNENTFWKIVFCD